jgi:hypothetical protein
MATVTIEKFNDGAVELYEDPDLRRDLSKMRVEERPMGFRLTFPRDSLGHGDLGTSFLLALLATSELSGQKRVRVGVVMEGNPYDRHDRRMAAADRHNAMLEAAGPHCGNNPFLYLAARTGRAAFGRMEEPDPFG